MNELIDGPIERMSQDSYFFHVYVEEGEQSVVFDCESCKETKDERFILLTGVKNVNGYKRDGIVQRNTMYVNVDKILYITENES